MDEDMGEERFRKLLEDLKRIGLSASEARLLFKDCAFPAALIAYQSLLSSRREQENPSDSVYINKDLTGKGDFPFYLGLRDKMVVPREEDPFNRKSDTPRIEYIIDKTPADSGFWSEGLSDREIREMNLPCHNQEERRLASLPGDKFEISLLRTIYDDMVDMVTDTHRRKDDLISPYHVGDSLGPGIFEESNIKDLQNWTTPRRTSRADNLNPMLYISSEVRQVERMAGELFNDPDYIEREARAIVAGMSHDFHGMNTFFTDSRFDDAISRRYDKVVVPTLAERMSGTAECEGFRFLSLYEPELSETAILDAVRTRIDRVDYCKDQVAGTLFNEKLRRQYGKRVGPMVQMMLSGQL
ncbi:MAG: hypothetical protein KJ709_05075 [Nanoarchaeota archaeon]|nr:hypothetical protein [Nanoarchaeota archaeon]